MSATGGPGARTSLYDHAAELHRWAPDGPLPRNGEPYPDDGSHRGRKLPEAPEGRSARAAAVARVLDAHFARPDAPPSALEWSFHDLHVPFHRHEAIAAAARRAGADRARHTGRWLVRHAGDRCSATVGLALLAETATADDVPLIRTVGLLSHRFGPLAAHALERLPGGPEALRWLADRVEGWGRVYVVEALCRLDDPAARPWLLRRAVDGDGLNGYFAGRVATVGRLHEALAEFGHDVELLDHTGRLLFVMEDCEGMGMSLRRYPHAAAVLAAHARNTGRLPPTVERFLVAAVLAGHLAAEPTGAAGPGGAVEPGGEADGVWRAAALAAYLAALDRDDWCATARAALAAGDGRMRWLADSGPSRIRLRAFADHRVRG
ncbi:hypothetical protein GCM10009759_30790 [Kitasatospora saccharophila]|uniref:HEAT repeat protein n=1 Tax=Kitasatospora saccharophila TaxID=407973 RepID=A0ABP5IFB6_9ACTN